MDDVDRVLAGAEAIADSLGGGRVSVRAGEAVAEHADLGEDLTADEVAGEAVVVRNG